MNTPASEQEWPTPKMLNDAQYAIGQLSLKYDIGHTPHREIARVVFETLRPLAGVDTLRTDTAHQGQEPQQNATTGVGFRSLPSVGHDPERRITSAHANCPNCGQHVEFKFHKPVGHTDVTVDELADILEEETWADVAAKLILSKYNVTRKVL